MAINKKEFAQTIKQQIESLEAIPAMPEVAKDLLRLRNNPHANINTLVAIVERDPGLAAQIIRHASSSIFGYGSKIDSIGKAVSLVLGFDMALHISLGVTTGKLMKMPAEGRLGRQTFWRHSVYSAQLVQALGSAMPLESRPQIGLCYLAGLLHNFGYLLLGHLYPSDFSFLSRFVEQQHTSIADSELHIIGVQHQQLGAWLMTAWGMPEELVVATSEHHSPYYDGRYSVYSKLVLVADRALARYSLGDSDSISLPSEILASLGLSEENIIQNVEKLLGIAPELDSFANQMAA